MARLRFGDQSVPRVTRVATGGGGGTIGGMSDVDLTDVSHGLLKPSYNKQVRAKCGYSVR